MRRFRALSSFVPFLLVTLAGSADSARAQTLSYVPGNSLTVRGELEVRGDVFGVFSQASTIDFAFGSFIVNPSHASISSSEDFTAAPTGTLIEGNCVDYGEGNVFSGTTAYDLQGSGDGIAFSASTTRNHNSFIFRSTTGTFTLLPRTVAGFVDLPAQAASEPLVVSVPFVVVPKTALLQVAPGDFCIDRSDTGNTTGGTSCEWRIYLDVDQNGAVTPGVDPVVHQSEIDATGVPFGSSSACNPGQILPVRRGHYVAEFVYATDSALQTTSPGCPDQVWEDSDVDDAVSFELTVI